MSDRIRESAAEKAAVDKLACIQCGHECCKWVGLQYPVMSGKALQFFPARGCKILKTILEDGREFYRIYVPSVCQHLEEGVGCRIYADRPIACVEYRGKDDPLVKDKCRIG